ncbi:zinc knuckle domain-containing protein [Cryptosporidium felis]|nr:zinc knuckle domain-containing protein [Cryptosporidium felis]
MKDAIKTKKNKLNSKAKKDELHISAKPDMETKEASHSEAPRKTEKVKEKSESMKKKELIKEKKSKDLKIEGVEENKDTYISGLEMSQNPTKKNATPQISTKTKGAKKKKKIKTGCWTPEMIQQSIDSLENRLGGDSGEQLSKSKKRRIISRLSKLKKGLRGEVEIGGQIQKSLKTIKREMKQKSSKSSIAVRKNSNIVCLCCRKKGHQMSDCRLYKPSSNSSPENLNSSSNGEQSATGKEVLKCFLCGELGHTLKDCKKPRNDNSVLPFASCFRCGNSGHIVAFCPNNKDGSIYPKGGCCNICGSVKHLARNCDQLAPKVKANKKEKKQRSSLEAKDPDLMWKDAME